ncbi:MAG: tRNA cytidylyltransferase [Gemmatimonas sp.]
MSETPLDIRPPGPVLDIVRTLRQAGFDSWCVGGAVRDALLGHAHLDWDLATSATPPQVRRLFERTVPVGIEFGTVGVLDGAGHMHEVTTFRRDVRHDGRHAVVEFGASLDEDLARRDFTINAIAYDPIARRIHDPFGGRGDLTARVVRAVGDPEARMLEDRLRALRAIRFASRFDFALDAATWRAIVASAPFLPRLSPERVKQEIEKTMEQVRRPSTAFRRWRDCGAFKSLVPALAEVGEQVLDAIDCLPAPGAVTRPQRRGLRIAALLSDLTASDADGAMRALRFSNMDIALVGALVARWQAEGPALTRDLCSANGVDDRAVRRLVSVVGRLRASAFVRLAAARWAAQRASSDGSAIAPPLRRVRDLHRRVMRSSFRDPIAVSDLAIDGDDLRHAGVRGGPQIGATLGLLLEYVLDEPARNTRDALLAHVAALMLSSPN